MRFSRLSPASLAVALLLTWHSSHSGISGAGFLLAVGFECVALLAWHMLTVHCTAGLERHFFPRSLASHAWPRWRAYYACRLHWECYRRHHG